MKLQVDESAALLLLGAAGRRTSQGANWARELEQAQTWNWFHGALSRPAAGLPPQGARQMAAERSSGVPPRRPDAAEHLSRVAVRPDDATQFRAPTLLPPSVEGLIAGSTETGVVNRFIGPGQVANEPAAAPDHYLPSTRDTCSPRGRDTPSADRTRAVRVHVERAPDGVAVWLGIDGDAALVAARASALLPGLRLDLASAGQRLAVLVCNGKAISPPASSTRKESP